jgi:hypothetical protein
MLVYLQGMAVCVSSYSSIWEVVGFPHTLSGVHMWDMKFLRLLNYFAHIYNSRILCKSMQWMSIHLVSLMWRHVDVFFEHMSKAMTGSLKTCSPQISHILSCNSLGACFLLLLQFHIFQTVVGCQECKKCFSTFVWTKLWHFVLCTCLWWNMLSSHL